MLRIKQGFPGQRRVVLPFYVSDEALSKPLTRDIVIHSMGFFPNALGHYIDRPTGCAEHLLIFCTKGKGYYTLYGVTHEVKALQFFVLPSNAAHSYRADETNPWTIYWTHFKGPGASEVARRIQGLHTLDISETSRLSDHIGAFNEILNVLEKSYDQTAVTFCNLCLKRLLASFLEVGWFNEAGLPERGESRASFVSKVTHIMEENLCKGLSLKDMASFFGYSESHFYRLFRKETGYAPYSFFLHMRMERARDLLENTTMGITQVASQSGFDDLYFFSKAFKKQYGVSPRQYRKNFHTA